jgi:hypothetical protein
VTTVPQAIHRREIARRLDRIGATQGTLARCAKISDSQLSLVLSGHKLLSEPAQIAIIGALNFFEKLAADSAPVPVRFSDADTIERLFKEYMLAHEADHVVRTAGELQEASAAK